MARYVLSDLTSNSGIGSGFTIHFQDEYRMLIVDGHAPHVTNKFIKFTKENKIVCLCLPAHSTHLLQPLDVSVFGPLKQNYKILLAEKTRFATYNIDKADFISLIQKATRYFCPKHTIHLLYFRNYLLVLIQQTTFYLAQIHQFEHVFFQVKYLQHQEMLNKSRRLKSLYHYSVIRP